MEGLDVGTKLQQFLLDGGKLTSNNPLNTTFEGALFSSPIPRDVLSHFMLHSTDAVSEFEGPLKIAIDVPDSSRRIREAASQFSRIIGCDQRLSEKLGSGRRRLLRAPLAQKGAFKLWLG
jgi:hypothetical protein